MREIGYRRRSPRVERIFLASVSQLLESGEIESSAIGRTLNLSEGGIMIELSEPIPFLSQVSFTIAIEEYLLNVKGEVVHIRKLPEGGIEMGVSFTRIDTEGRQKLKDYIY